MLLMRYAQRVAAATAMSAMLFAGAAEAQPRRWGEFRQDQWQQIDTRQIAPGTNNVVLPVSRFDGRHTAVRLQVLDEPVFITALQVTYQNGTQNQIPIRRLLRPGEVTQPLDLEGGARLIRDVRVSFQQDRDWRRTARLVLLGDVVDRGPPPPPVAGGPGRPPIPLAVLRGELPKDWVLFGVQRASIGGDRDVVYVGRERGRFDKIALRVRGNDVMLRDLKVRYANGDIQDLAVNQRIRADERTADITLDRPQFIENIELIYSSSRRGGTEAVVEIWGQVSPSWLRGEGRDPNFGWMLAGTQTASMFRRDNDNYEVGQRFGRVKRVRLFVRNGEVDLRALTFRFGNGDTQRVELRQTLRRNETSNEIVLPSRSGFDGRQIQTITLEHQSRPTLGGEAVVELWLHP